MDIKYNNNNKYDLENDIRFSILTVAEKCGIDYDPKPIGHGRFIGQCPFCESSSKKLSLVVDDGKKYKNSYRCFKCGKYGSAISLYGEMKGLDNKTALKELANDGEITNNVKIKRALVDSKEHPSCLETADIDTLDKVYNDFLKLLPLYQSSIDNLKKRGLSDQYIKLKQYKSLPKTYQERYAIADKLIKMGYKLEGIAGFYKDEYNHWTFTKAQGFLIPIRTLEGKICSFQIRLDKKIGKLRYLYFTSSKYETGAKALAAPSISYGRDTKTVYITEGVLKGDVATYFSNDTFISVPGVNSAIDILIDILKKINPINTVICYDMDMYDNEDVKKALLKLIRLLNDVGIYCEIKLWDKNFKGIDDYYQAIHK
ncbi:CHC2 zinc finger domain-containing protein (plasmid) [Clostridium perfringens]|uniref:CHC2 zinc finger domain-containing protein n=1 Tax=Clostridium perfringens TaxID=1502 RepID=UPI000B369C89|nr:CHC2 zinc finger domain-containing protein [Clostridium perfringens]EGT0691006.1 DUF3854 domain-containing protein [Clostridium perfringens]EGT0694192.1 DUF3854 domain-containing protein [Clostridium perfringens]EGT0697145.1 DUF3854 domain-containing protein [Clostridium perfringens]MDU3376286.1 CHC2 zinc finger domain-containing protein [Clostridium perfringens]MDU3536366.1 CHC2 zinc finger domain-containing protein [Clostridium perfringens]